jgi:hypothetical protein
MEPERSLPCSQAHASNPPFPSYSLKIHFNITFPSMPKSFLVISFLQVFLPKFCMYTFTSMCATCLSYPISSVALLTDFTQ